MDGCVRIGAVLRMGTRKVSCLDRENNAVTRTDKIFLQSSASKDKGSWVILLKLFYFD